MERDAQDSVEVSSSQSRGLGGTAIARSSFINDEEADMLGTIMSGNSWRGIVDGTTWR